MIKYKVISVHSWWSSESLASKMEEALNIHSKDEWVLDRFELGQYGYSAIIALKKQTP